MNKSKKTACILFLGLFVIFGCKTKSNLPPSNEKVFELTIPTNTFSEHTSAILFLNCSITRDNHISVIDYKIRQGSAKTPRTLPISKKGLFYQLTDSKNQIIQTQYLSNPLVYEAESLSENGTFKRKEIHFDKADFTIRTNIDPTITKIIIGTDKENSDILLTILLKS